MTHDQIELFTFYTAVAAIIISSATGYVQILQFLRDRRRIVAAMHWGVDQRTDAVYLTNLSGVQIQVDHYCFIHRRYRFMRLFPVDTELEIESLVNTNLYFNIPPRDQVTLSFTNDEPFGSPFPGTKATGYLYIKLNISGEKRPVVKKLFYH